MDPAQLQPGHRLDRYELLCALAYGGMASVWLARFGGRRGFERLVVVKMILPQYASDPRFQEMFVDEARIASRIEHANVARILDVGEHDENTTYIVMEWVDGDSLSKVVRAAEQRKQRVPAGIALRICADAAAGLHAAHVLTERDGTPLGVVHRDVSPQNILISNAGSTVIIDFGVAKARDRVSQDTSAGQLKGKIRYMAPEQALGGDIDHRADVWAMGVVLYELFAGESPYDGPNEVATLHMLTSGAPPPPLPWHVPDPIRRVIERALAYDPRQRFSSALELNVALEAAMIEIGEPTSASVVAEYTGRLLADRKLARKRAVDVALDAAYARDADRINQTVPSSISGTSSPAITSFPVSNAAQLAAPPALALERAAALASSGHMQAHGYPGAPPRQPSGTHNTSSYPPRASRPGNTTTLGAAAMEYPPASQAQLHEAARKRRVLTIAVLSVSIMAGVIGAGLIVSTAILRHQARAAAIPTTEASELPQFGTDFTPPLAAPPAADAGPATAPSAASARAAAPATPAPAPSAAPGHKPAKGTKPGSKP